MTFKSLKQLYRHDPDNGVYGDCFRTCIAMVFGLEPDQVPHFCGSRDENSTWRRDFEQWIGERGYSYVEIPMQWSDTCFAFVLAQMELTGNDVAIIVDGISPRGTLHSVVVYKGELHDPHPDGGGIVAGNEDLLWLRVIAPRAGQYGNRKVSHDH